MEQEQTTTETGVQETNGVESAPTPSTESTQPEVEPKVEAESNVTEDSSPTEATSSNDEDLSKWAESKGLNLEDPESVQKLAKSYREAEKKLHETTQTKSELEKQLVPPGTEYQFTPDGNLDVYSEVQNVKT